MSRLALSAPAIHLGAGNQGVILRGLLNVATRKGHPDDPPWLFFTASTSAWTAVPPSVRPTSSSERRQSASSTHYSASGDAVAVVLRSQIQFRVNADREREYLREHARWQSVHRVCCAGSPALEEPIQGSLG
jgi:hypothetical protein